MRILILVLTMCLAVGCTVDATESTAESEMRAVHSYCDGWQLCTVYVSNDGYVTDIVCTTYPVAECVGTEEGFAPAQERAAPLTAPGPGCPKCHGAERSPRGLVLR